MVVAVADAVKRAVELLVLQIQRVLEDALVPGAVLADVLLAPPQREAAPRLEEGRAQPAALGPGGVRDGRCKSGVQLPPRIGLPAGNQLARVGLEAAEVGDALREALGFLLLHPKQTLALLANQLLVLLVVFRGGIIDSAARSVASRNEISGRNPRRAIDTCCRFLLPLSELCFETIDMCSELAPLFVSRDCLGGVLALQRAHESRDGEQQQLVALPLDGVPRVLLGPVDSVVLERALLAQQQGARAVRHLAQARLLCQMLLARSLGGGLVFATLER